MSNTEQKVKIIKINSSYTENKPTNHKFVPISEIINNIRQVKIGKDMKIMDKNTNSPLSNTMFEIIGNICIPYFDVEGINDNTDMNDHSYIISVAESLKKELSEMSKKEIKYYRITYNNSSHTHKGKSYHIYFPEWASYKDQVQKFVNWYIENKKLGSEYVDGSVYSKDRLFRLPLQQAVNNQNTDNDVNERSKDFHRFINVDDVNHLEDFIIGNVKGKTVITFPTIPNKFRKMKPKNVFSGPLVLPKKIEDMCEAITTAITGKAPAPITTDENIYSRAMALKELIDETDKSFTRYLMLVNEFIKYYKEHNNSYDGFRLTIESIGIILDMIQKKL